MQGITTLNEIKANNFMWVCSAIKVIFFKKNNSRESDFCLASFFWFLRHSKASTMYVIDLEWNSCRCMKSCYLLFIIFYFFILVDGDVVIRQICEIIISMVKQHIRHRLMSNSRYFSVWSMCLSFCVIFMNRCMCDLHVEFPPRSRSSEKITIEFGTNFSFQMLTSDRQKFHTHWIMMIRHYIS